MTTETETDAPIGPQAPFRLPPRSDLAAAPALHVHLLAARGDVALDLSAVEVLTTPVAQVLLAAGDQLRRGGGSLALDRPSGAALRCLSELGLDPGRITSGPRSAEARA